METVKEYLAASTPPRVLELVEKLKASAGGATSEVVTRVILTFFEKHFNIE